MSTSREAPPTKPLLFAESLFDDTRQDDVELSAPNWDASYVPGYGERIRESEQRVKAGKKPIKGARLQWVRIAGKHGDVSESDEGMTQWRSLGYRACGTDDLKANGWKMPPTAHVGPDGLIRRGDLALFILSEKRAEINRERARRANAEVRENGPSSATGEVYEVVEERKEVKGSLKELSDLPTL